MSKAQQKSEPAETVLLRHPLPKYSFQARKLPKENPSNTPVVQENAKDVKHSSEKSVDSAESYLSGQRGPLSNHSEAVRSNSQMSRVLSEGALTEKKSVTVRPLPAAPKLADAFAVATGKGASKPTAAVMASKVQAVLQNRGLGDTLTETASVNELVAAALRRERETRRHESGIKNSHPEASRNPASTAPQAVSQPGASDDTQTAGGRGAPSAVSLLETVAGVPVPDADLLAHAVEGPSDAEKLRKAEQETEMLKSQLEVQLQVNAELKRLLVASVGEDLERRIENLARDRAQLAMELGDFTKKMTEDYENLDQISIQADMWRTKYLASRVMMEELASGRAFYSAQFHDSQQAMQQLLNERYELRAQMLQAYKCLQQVKEAFDPFNAQRSPSLSSTNALDLSKSIRQLSEAVRFRLIPAHAGSHVMLPLEDTMESTMTEAEAFAYELLCQQATPPSFKHSVPGVFAQRPAKSYERFHPLVRQDNLTMNCCAHCKGEIKLA